MKGKGSPSNASIARWYWFAFVVAIACSVTAVFAQGAAVRATETTTKVGEHAHSRPLDPRPGAAGHATDRTVVALSTPSIDGRRRSGKPLTMADARPLDSPNAKVLGEPRLLEFPLTVGKKWGFKHDVADDRTGAVSSVHGEASVVAFEKVKVGSRVYEAYRIDFSGCWNSEFGRSPFQMQGSNWFAPAVRTIVKSQYTDGFTDWGRQIVEYQVPH